MNTTEYKRHNIICKCLDMLGIRYSANKNKPRAYSGKNINAKYIIEIYFAEDQKSIFDWFSWGSYRDKKIKIMNTKKQNRCKHIYVKETRELYGDFEVYDLGMKNQQNPYFLHNGIYTHNSLYPNLIRTFNISFDTKCIPGEPNSITIDNTAFNQDKTGLIPQLLNKTIALRKTYQDQLKKYTPNDPEYQTLYNIQYAVKTISNGYYGILGYSNFRLYDKEVAEAITKAGQMMIKEVYKYLKSNEYESIYGDTDSVFVQLKTKIKEEQNNEMNELTEKINNNVKEFVNTFNVEKNYLEMDCEKKFTKLIFMGVKKRYIGYADFWKGKWVDKPIFIIKGYDLARRTLAPVIKTLIKTILEMILQDKNKEEIKKYYNEEVEKIKKMDIKEIAWNVTLGKPIEEYQKTIPQHVKAAMVSKELMGIEFKKDDVMKIMYIQPMQVKIQDKIITSDVIAFYKETEIPPHIISRIDYKRFVESFIINKLDDFYGIKGMNMEYITGENTTTLNDFF
jgi:DNA polymerase I